MRWAFQEVFISSSQTETLLKHASMKGILSSPTGLILECWIPFVAMALNL